MKLLSSVIAAGLVVAAATTASAIVTVDYGWENGGTILGSYGNVTNPLNVATATDPLANTVTPLGGSAMLQVGESPHSGTPQAYLAVVSGVSSGATVTASFSGWEYSDGASPSMRIWGHYLTDLNDIDSYGGSAGGSLTYTSASNDWSEVSYTWTYDDDGGARAGLVIEARLYSTPSTDPSGYTEFWIDELHVEAPDGATITTPIPEPATLALLGLGALAIAFRRRR